MRRPFVDNSWRLLQLVHRFKARIVELTQSKLSFEVPAGGSKEGADARVAEVRGGARVERTLWKPCTYSTPDINYD